MWCYLDDSARYTQSQLLESRAVSGNLLLDLSRRLLQPCRERPHALMPPCCIFKSCLPRGHWPQVHPVRRWEQVCASRAYRSCIMQNLTAFIMILCVCWAAVEKNDNISDLPMFILSLKSLSLSPDYHHSRGSMLHS